MTDENAGKGGSYLFDPKTGTRTLVERTAEPRQPSKQQPAAEEPVAGVPDPTTDGAPTKSKKGA